MTATRWLLVCAAAAIAAVILLALPLILAPGCQ